MGSSLQVNTDFERQLEEQEMNGQRTKIGPEPRKPRSRLINGLRVEEEEEKKIKEEGGGGEPKGGEPEGGDPGGGEQEEEGKQEEGEQEEGKQE
ncbi:unnamed protein product [Nesidiocoris tenuis]|uniref:Uncharacterized protein n=1 Tax=Nesidiocoris tenuis TaxID=355587 RepID=A0A6H5FZ17_9HEMI|nr:unnamed protein product [Nesidiocoris tenuis]